MILVGLTADEAEATEASPLASYVLKAPYADAVARAGALPVILPYLDAGAVDALLDRLDAVVVTGGAFDVSPALYGAAPAPGLGPLKAARTAFEAALTQGALARGLPLLGVCGGMQLLAVLAGGTLLQDLPTERPDALAHEQATDSRQPAHPVAVTAGTRLAAAVGEGGLDVNSTHHQAVDDPGRLTVSAVAPDGVVEAVEDRSAAFVVGVQWHPERLVARDPRHQGLYDALVAAAAARAAGGA